jgi:hypothetical protein
MSPDQEYADKPGRIHREDVEGIARGDFTKDGNNLVVEKDQQGGDPPGEPKSKCQERNDSFCFHDIVSFLFIFDDDYSLQFSTAFVPYRRIGCGGRLNKKEPRRTALKNQ